MTAAERHPAIIIFIKNPEKGKVKTRLAASLGDDEALRIYQELLRYTREVTLKIPVERFLFYSDYLEHDDGWSEQHFQKKLQSGSDLGEKMEKAFGEVFQTHAPVLIIGSDCPKLTPGIIQNAFAKLSEYDFVIGPAHDGGYYLLGMRDFQPAVFKNMQWSHRHVKRDTVAKIEALSKTCAFLQELPDIDTAEDWQTFGW